MVSKIIKEFSCVKLFGKPGIIIVTDESGLTATGEYTPTVIPVVQPKPPTPPYVPPKTGV